MPCSTSFRHRRPCLWHRTDYYQNNSCSGTYYGGYSRFTFIRCMPQTIYPSCATPLPRAIALPRHPSATHRKHLAYKTICGVAAKIGRERRIFACAHQPT